jgi:hypothetical protein
MTHEGGWTSVPQDHYPRQSRERGWPTSRPVREVVRMTLGEKVATVVSILAAVFVIVMLCYERGAPLQ